MATGLLLFFLIRFSKSFFLALFLFFFLIETGFRHVGQAGLELLTLGDPHISASQSAGITGVSHCSCQLSYFHYLVTLFEIALALLFFLK